MNTVTAKPLYRTEIDTGKHWSLRVRRGLVMQLENLEGPANVGMVMYNAEDTRERYNAPDTLKCQHTFHLSQGHCLYSDMGRIFASIIHDSAGGHETICGNTDRSLTERLYGARNYQQHRNDWHQNGHDAFLVELAKYGLDRRDLPSNINWFSQCRIQSEGGISLQPDHGGPGSTVTLRFEMDTLVVLHTCPHPMRENAQWPKTRMVISLTPGEPVAEDDPCLNHCDENRRGFRNNALYYLGTPSHWPDSLLQV